MALTYDRIFANNSIHSGGVWTISSIATTDESLVLMQIVTYCDSLDVQQHFAPTGDAITGATFLGAEAMDNGLGGELCVEWYSAIGTGATDAVDMNYVGSGFNFTGGVTDQTSAAVWEITGLTGLSVIRSAHSAATNATASVTLADAVVSGNECAYLGAWVDPVDSATAGSGWTELDPGGDFSLAISRNYLQYHPTPSGAQNGQVSSIASQSNAALIVEVGNQTGGGGFGHIPIN